MNRTQTPEESRNVPALRDDMTGFSSPDYQANSFAEGLWRRDTQIPCGDEPQRV